MTETRCWVCDTIFFDIHPDIDGRCRECLAGLPAIGWRHVLWLGGAALAIVAVAAIF